MKVFKGRNWHLAIGEDGFAAWAKGRDRGDAGDGRRYEFDPGPIWEKRGFWQWSEVDRLFCYDGDGVWRLYAHPAPGVDPASSSATKPYYSNSCDGWMLFYLGNFTFIGWRRVASAVRRYSAGSVGFDSSALPIPRRWLIGNSGRRPR
ncbi:hypothetical protein ACFP2T_32515 [Plantactinospora solaniradicis]|uniref:Uncharacterized protein n=1 Tax=Plantactinospora solaniradicis TaxID=1723736 RepID=A0ABW1KGL7_9ACTN